MLKATEDCLVPILEEDAYNDTIQDTSMLKVSIYHRRNLDMHIFFTISKLGPVSNIITLFFFVRNS